MNSRKLKGRVIMALLPVMLVIACKPRQENKNSFLAGSVWKLNTLRTELPQWMVKWDSTEFEPGISRQYFETLIFNNDGEVQVKRYRDVPDKENGTYYYEKGSWVYEEDMEVLLLDLNAAHQNERDSMKYKAEYQVDRISEDTLRLTRIRVIVKQGDFRDH